MPLLLVFACSFFIGSCSEEDDNQEFKTTYKYLYAADARNNIPEAERLKYAPYGWRLECLSDEAMAKNFRTCQSEFIEREAKTGYDASYVPSREGLDQLRASASAEFTSAGLDGILAEIRKLHNGPVTIVDLRSESHGLLNGIHVSRYGLQN